MYGSEKLYESVNEAGHFGGDGDGAAGSAFLLAAADASGKSRSANIKRSISRRCMYIQREHARARESEAQKRAKAEEEKKLGVQSPSN